MQNCSAELSFFITLFFLILQILSDSGETIADTESDESSEYDYDDEYDDDFIDDDNDLQIYPPSSVPKNGGNLIIWLNMFHLYIHKDRFPLFCFFEVYIASKRVLKAVTIYLYDEILDLVPTWPLSLELVPQNASIYLEFRSK